MPGMFGNVLPKKMAGDPGGLMQIASRTPQIKPPRPGFNDPGGMAEKLGTLGAMILTNAGNPLGPSLMGFRQREQLFNQQRQQELLDREEERAFDWKDFVRRETFRRENPAPVNNDTVADYQFIAERLGPEAAESFLRNKTLPPPFVQKNPDGTSTIFPAGLPRGETPSGPAKGAVVGGFRFKGGNPNDKASWEAIGGASPSNGSRPFP